MGEFMRNQLPDPISYYEAEGMKLQGKGPWLTTSCIFHGGSDSMGIHAATGGFLCRAGCGAKGGDVLAFHMAAHGLGFVEAAKALGAWHDDGKPNQPQRPKPLPASLALQVLTFESNLAAIAAGNLACGVILTSDDYARLLLAAQRIATVNEAYQ